MKCEIVSYAKQDPNNLGASYAAHRCVTHNMTVDEMSSVGTVGCLCPIGRISVAADEAVARIEAAEESFMKTALFDKI